MCWGVGSEYASTFAALGVKVHLIDGRDVLMPFLDKEISQGLAEAMAANGVQFHWNERVAACDASSPGDVILTMSSGARLSCDGVLVCAGRQSNTANLNSPAPGSRWQAGTHSCNDISKRLNTSMSGYVVGPPRSPRLASTGARAIVHALGFDVQNGPSVDPAERHLTFPASMAGNEAGLSERLDFIVGRARMRPSAARSSGIRRFLKLSSADDRCCGFNHGRAGDRPGSIGLMALCSAQALTLYLACFTTLRSGPQNTRLRCLCARAQPAGGVTGQI